VSEAEPILKDEEAGKSLMTLPLICDLHTFIQQVPLPESRRQKFGIGLGEINISDQVVEVFKFQNITILVTKAKFVGNNGHFVYF
jgi:hypothetical protein